MSNKFDLCSNTVTLDYQELIYTARVAVHYAREALQQALRKWYGLGIEDKLTNLDADWMLQDAGALTRATTTLHYLIEGQTREEIKIER